VTCLQIRRNTLAFVPKAGSPSNHKALGETLEAGMKTALQFRAAVLGAVAARMTAE